MILVEADVSEEWDSSTNWQIFAEKAVRAAMVHSRFAALADGSITLEISVKYTGDAEVQALNAAWRGKDKPTNVLSFPMIEPEQLGTLASGEALLGDIVLAQGICTAEAQDMGIAVANHAAHLIVHGTLHLLGYDHETGDADAAAMEAIERRALESIGIQDPYPVQEVQA